MRQNVALQQCQFDAVDKVARIEYVGPSMKCIIPAALSIFLFFCQVSSAEEPAEKKHPIDIQTEKLGANAQSTAAGIEVYTKGAELWDAEMNRVYKELLQALPEKAATALKSSQKQWLIFRDEHYKFIDECFSKYEGTMYLPMHVAAKMNVVRERTLQLLHRLEMQKQYANPE